MKRSVRFLLVPGPLAALALICVALALAPAAAGAPLGEPTDRYFVYQLDNISTVHALEVLATLNFEVLPLGTPGTAENLRRPVVVELPDSHPELSSLVKKENTNLGGNPLAGPTVGQAHQRLMIVWDATDPDSLERLLGLLREQIDVRAKQILIEAVVLELDRDRIRDLGVTFEASQHGASASFPGVDDHGFSVPFTYIFQRPSLKTLLDLKIRIEALVRSGEASVKSQPSIMVLDGRQARIKVGDNIPYTQIASSGLDLESQLITDTKYLETGITLNLRPRAAADDSEVTMQVETLISTPSGPSFVIGGGVVGPQISTREVQTLVRVADDTPFIIGGLIADDDLHSQTGIPVLSKIPGLGALFRRSNHSRLQKEVIIVITPHILPLTQRNFRYSVLGKDFENLDHFDLKLFRNLYRIKSEDVFDLDFIYESDLFGAMQRAAGRFGRQLSRRAVAAGMPPVPPGDRAALAAQLRQALVEQPHLVHEIERSHPGLEIGEPLIHLVAGGIPGEEILVKRMVLAIIEKLDFGRHVDPQAITFFNAEAQDDIESLELLEIDRLAPRLANLGEGCGGETLRMTFDTELTTIGEDTEVSFDPPGAKLSTLPLASDVAYLKELRRLNQPRERAGWDGLGILLNDCYRIRGRSTLDVLRNLLVLKRVLDINPALPLTLDAFHPGRELVFPSVENLRARSHVVDRKVAAMFYETTDYFYAFEKRFELALHEIKALAREAEPPRSDEEGTPEPSP